MSARLPGRRPAIIPVSNGASWYETTGNRVLAIVLGTIFGGVALHSFLAWSAQ